MMSGMSKNHLIIGFLITTNFISGTYILAKEHNIKSFFNSEKKSVQNKPPVKMSPETRLKIKMQKYRMQVLRPQTQKQQSHLEMCYQALLMREPRMDEGTLVAQWMIHPDGKMTDLELREAQWGDEDFRSCVKDYLGEMKFDAPPDPMGTMVAHKFHFTRNDTDKMNF